MTAQVRPSFTTSFRGLEDLLGLGRLSCDEGRDTGCILALATLDLLEGWSGAFSSKDLCLFGAVSDVIEDEGGDHIDGP